MIIYISHKNTTVQRLTLTSKFKWCISQRNCMAAYNYQFLSSSHLCSVQAHQSWLEVDLQISPFPATAVYSHFVPFHPLLLSLQWLIATWRESPKTKLTFERVDEVECFITYSNCHIDSFI